MKGKFSSFKYIFKKENQNDFPSIYDMDQMGE